MKEIKLWPKLFWEKYTFMILLGSLASISQPILAANDILILDTTNSTQVTSAATTNGLSYDVVDATAWGAMTTAQFAEYKAIILADPRCYYNGPGDTAPVTAAEANAATWGAAVTGNVIILGTDEVYHSKSLVTEKAMAFAASEAGKTGAYVSLGCYYNGSAALTPVPLLDAFVVDGFTATQVPGCFDSAHIVATHPALTGLTDAYLSGWSCSVHEAFDTWPSSFEVLAIATTGGVYTAPDGTIGTPYLLARGVTVTSDIDLAPLSATNPIGTSHMLTATVAEDDIPSVDVTVMFAVIDGPNIGVAGEGITDGGGVATWTYSSAVAGTDTIEAVFVDSLGRSQRSNRVTKEWIGLPPIACNAGSDISVNEASSFSLDGSTSSGGSGALSYSWIGTLPLVDADTSSPSGTSPVVDGNQSHSFTLTVSDEAGQSESCDVLLTVIDSDLPPNCDYATSSPSLLWPPNHKMVDVTISGVVDVDSGASILIFSATQDEPTNGLGDGDTGPDASLDGATARVRAERSGLEDGRVVQLGFTATDALGQSCAGYVMVGIPHDKKDVPVDSGQLYDATSN